MSGIFGLFNQDGALVQPSELRDMASLLTRRGPERTGLWRAGSVGVGHTLLSTTPESRFERLPLQSALSGCVITADVRLDNRTELLARLSLADRAVVTGDAEIVLAAYLAWGEKCVEYLLGDFAFAIWDPRKETLFCARDHMGMRSLYYHHTPGRFFAFATEPRAILVLPKTPYVINDERVADYLVQKLEGVDKASTFFEEVFRLPPAHTMTVTPQDVRQERYWTLEPGPELRLTSDDAYAEAFLEVFTEAVRCRLRAVEPAGSMLSGGVDSGTIVAVARQLLADKGRGSLHTFSAIAPDCDPETRAIRAALAMGGLDAHIVSYADLGELLPDLTRLTWNPDEPFDGHLTLIRAIYLAAHRSGLKVLLDGVGGDTVLSNERYVARLLRAGHWRVAHSETVGQNAFWKGMHSPRRELIASARAAFVPYMALRRLRTLRQQMVVGAAIRGSLINKEFARQVHLGDRLQQLQSHILATPLSHGGIERARAIDHPYLVVGREHYDRVAGSVGMEPRDPFLDLRVANFCVRLPDSQTQDGGWPKVILRRATAGHLPDSIRWRRGQEHLGWTFTKAILEASRDILCEETELGFDPIRTYVDVNEVSALYEGLLNPIEGHQTKTDAERLKIAYNVVLLSRWLRNHATRPRPRPVGTRGENQYGY